MRPAEPDAEARVVGLPRDLRESEAMLAEAQRLAKIGSFELDVATSRLTWSHQQFRNFGLAFAPAIDRAVVVDRIHPEDLARHEAIVRQAIEAGEAFALDYRVVHPDGRVVAIHTIGRPVFDAAGRVTKLVGTSQDVTERAGLEARLREQNEALRRLGELRSSFVNAIAHEVRTPLTTVLGYVEFLDEAAGATLAPEHRRYVAQIARGARRIEHLLDDLLDIAAIEAGAFTLRPAAASLGERVLEVLEGLRPQAEAAQVRLASRLDDAGCLPELDAQRIGQVLTNLVGNAIKFSPPGSTITATTAARAGHVRCEVADAGPGIPAAQLDRLFKRFSQLEAGVAAGKGTGLGLSIAKALVEAHGGTIGVESAPGAGSTFWFELPLRR